MPYFFFLLLMGLAAACGDTMDTAGRETAAEATDNDPISNPPAEGFDLAGSDERAIAIADSVMLAMGGRRAWDETRYLRWNFFGRRTLLWDKKENRVRIEFADGNTIYLLDMDDNTGRVLRNGTEISEPDSLDHYLQQARSIWINDSYWLVQPFKYKDSGVTLTHQGRDTTPSGQPADVLQLTFRGVGDTPDNKYRVFIGDNPRLQIYWQFFRNAADTVPAFGSVWENYRSHGEILLSGERGERDLTDIEVLQEVDEYAFSEFAVPES